jgi:hypothetical protein
MITLIGTSVERVSRSSTSLRLTASFVNEKLGGEALAIPRRGGDRDQSSGLPSTRRRAGGVVQPRLNVALTPHAPADICMGREKRATGAAEVLEVARALIGSALDSMFSGALRADSCGRAYVRWSTCCSSQASTASRR